MDKLLQLVDVLRAQQAQKADYVLDSRVLRMAGGQIMANGTSYQPNRVMHEGLSDKLGIPMKYYQKLQAELPLLLDENVNGWLQKQAGKKVLLRTFESEQANIARAFLSDRYLALDNFDVLMTALDAIKQMGVNVEIKHADVTDRRLYLDVTCPDVEIQAPEVLKDYLRTNGAAGDGIISGLTISNSEVGDGSFNLRPRAVVIKCDNGLIRPDDTFSRIHLGGKLKEGVIQWSDETRAHNLRLVMSQVKDAIKTFFSKEYVGQIVKELAKAQEIELEHPVDAIKNLTRDLRYNEAQQQSILDFFVKDGDQRASGIAHAITRHAQREDADTRHDMERDAFEALGRVHRFDHVAKN
jgi:hypothetical protein